MNLSTYDYNIHTYVYFNIHTYFFTTKERKDRGRKQHADMDIFSLYNPTFNFAIFKINEKINDFPFFEISANKCLYMQMKTKTKLKSIFLSRCITASEIKQTSGFLPS